MTTRPLVALALAAGLAAISLSAPARGEDLMQIYREAVANDPAIASSASGSARR